jgi:hypothetical protein
MTARRFPAALGPQDLWAVYDLDLPSASPSEGTVNVSTLRWHALGDEGGATTLATGGG